MGLCDGSGECHEAMYKQRSIYRTDEARLVNMSNVQAVERAEKARIDAMNVAAEEKQNNFMEKKNCREEIDKVNKKANKKIADMKNKIQFWKMVAIGTLAVGILIGWIL